MDLGTDIHVILDNLALHKSAMINEWLKDRLNGMFTFTRTSTSWTPTVECLVARPILQKLKIAVVASLYSCLPAIEGYIEHHNGNRAGHLARTKNPTTPLRHCNRVTKGYRTRHRPHDLIGRVPLPRYRPDSRRPQGLFRPGHHDIALLRGSHRPRQLLLPPCGRADRCSVRGFPSP